MMCEADGVPLTKRFLLSWAANAIALVVATFLLSRVTYASDGDLILAAIVFGILNTILKPFLKLVTFPLAVLTLGIAWFAVSMLMLVIVDWLVDGFEIRGFWTLVWATLIVWAVNLVLDLVPGPWRARRGGGRRKTR
jgi:putative membrane protein